MTTPAHLPHASDDCTGEWVQVGKRLEGLWRCPACGTEHPSTPENDRAADLEYVRGAQLRNELRRARFIDNQPPPPLPGLWLDIPHAPDEGEEWKEDGVH